MSVDLQYLNVSADGDFYISLPDNPNGVTGNRLLANIFEVCLLTNVENSLLSNGFGGNGTSMMALNYDPNDLQSIAAMLQVVLDYTVATIKADQNSFGQSLPKEERIDSASLVNVSKDGENVAIQIKVVPEVYEAQFLGTGIIVSLPL